MELCDTLIIGGGPAGSTCAWKLRQAGLDVMVMDRQAFPRDKPCAGWITPEVVEALKLDVAAYSQQYVWQPFSGFCTSYLGETEIATDYGHPISYGIRRCEFDHYLLCRSGAHLLLGEKVQNIQRDGNGWLVNGRIFTPLLIGAGGHFCPVARLLKPKNSPEQVVVAQEVEFEMSAAQQRECQVRPDMPELFFCQDLKGYGWVVRKQGFLNIGLGREDNQRLSEHVSDFLQFLQERGKIPQGIPDSFHGHAYLLYSRTPREVINDNVLLIGDAAGLAYDASGEGIRPAIESALMAADVVLGAKHYRRSALQPYLDKLTARFGSHRRRSLPVPRLPQSWKRFLARQLLATHWFPRHFVLDRWFLHKYA